MTTVCHHQRDQYALEISDVALLPYPTHETLDVLDRFIIKPLAPNAVLPGAWPSNPEAAEALPLPGPACLSVSLHHGATYLARCREGRPGYVSMKPTRNELIDRAQVAAYRARETGSAEQWELHAAYCRTVRRLDGTLNR